MPVAQDNMESQERPGQGSALSAGQSLRVLPTAALKIDGAYRPLIACNHVDGNPHAAPVRGRRGLTRACSHAHQVPEAG